MSWAPIFIALVLGLLISATLHFIFIWPAQEPLDDETGDDIDGSIVISSPNG